MDDEQEHQPNNPVLETVSFPFDRMTVARFRETFPKARWSDRLQAWTVPGSTARRRIDRWLASEADRKAPFEEERGRDLFEFEPILSPYLEVHGGGLRVRTPYSRAVVDELRQISFARWNGEAKAWEVPFAFYEELQQRWEAIEDAAKRAEPEERRKRAQARTGTEEEARTKRRATERRKKRLPVASDEMPPLGRPVATPAYGVVVATEVTGELVDPAEVAEHHPGVSDEHVWVLWRLPTLEELIHTWPAQHEPIQFDRNRGWWQPTLDELRDARRQAKMRERRKRKDGHAHDGARAGQI
ncbi:hypothetical protein [Agrobacterium pusense]|uniref:hypothetical protein n=1 Tax=Agrobacterium pusense TaxID=648995 RepID=UPI00156B6900|nr:hypothetical protein [Agrobacterium pusense]QKJ94725.1 hypothetical protein HQN82_25470 [Agrobacterium pusense]